MPSRLAYARIMVSSVADMAMPDFSARANNKRLASRVSVMLVESFFSILVFYHYSMGEYHVHEQESMAASPLVGIGQKTGQTPDISALNGGVLRRL